MAYQAISFVAFEQPTAAKWNILGTNDAEFNDLISRAASLISIGEDNVNDHTVINAGTSKLVKTKTLIQDISSNVYTKNSITLTGWSFVQGSGASKRVNDTIAFGVTFSSAPKVQVTFAGLKNGSDPAAIGELLTPAALIGDHGVAISSGSVTTSTSSVQIIDSDVVWGASMRIGYTWSARGQLN